MKRHLAIIGMLGALLGVGTATAQQNYPAKTVEVIVGFPPGGGNDVLTRIVAEKLQATLGQPFVVINKPGANGFIAFDAVKRAAPDGYTLLVGPSSGMAVNPAVFEKLPYDPVVDFAPVTMVGGFPLFVVVHPDSPIKTIGELIAQAKKKPGEFPYGSAATSFQLATEMFAQRAGISLYHIPYQGSGKVVQAVLAKEVPLTFADSAVAVPQINGGRLRAIAVSTSRRVNGLPDVPTIAESGVPDFEIVLWSGVFAPAGTHAAIVQKLQAEIVKVLQQPDVVARLNTLGVEPIGSTSEQLRAAIVSQIRQYKEVAKVANIKVN